MRAVSLACLCLITFTAETRSGTRLGRELRTRSRESVLVVAHRGDSGEYPENTLAAMESAAHMGVDLVEFDVYQSSDGELFCIHDQTIDRTTDGVDRLARQQVLASSLTLKELKQLDAGSWKSLRFKGEQIPTLDEALDQIGDRSIALIEVKHGEAKRLSKLLRRRRQVDRVVVQSFDWDYLRQLRQLEPELTLGALGSKTMTLEQLDQVRKLEAEIVHWNAWDLKVEDLRVLHKQELLVLVYTLDSDLEMAGAAHLGIGGVTTNQPHRLMELIHQGFARRD